MGIGSDGRDQLSLNEYNTVWSRWCETNKHAPYYVATTNYIYVCLKCDMDKTDQLDSYKLLKVSVLKWQITFLAHCSGRQACNAVARHSGKNLLACYTSNHRVGG